MGVPGRDGLGAIPRRISAHPRENSCGMAVVPVTAAYCAETSAGRGPTFMTPHTDWERSKR